MGKIDIRTDTTKNRLYIGLSGFFSGADLEPTLSKIRAELEKVRADFDVITDIKSFIPGSTVRDLLVRAGARVLSVETEADPELLALSQRERIEAVWARGRELKAVKSSLTAPLLS